MAKSKKKNAKIDFEEITIHEENKLIIFVFELVGMSYIGKILKKI